MSNILNTPPRRINKINIPTNIKDERGIRMITHKNKFRRINQIEHDTENKYVNEDEINKKSLAQLQMEANEIYTILWSMIDTKKSEKSGNENKKWRNYANEYNNASNNKREIGRGSYGNVYQIIVPSETKENEDDNSFAVKELHIGKYPERGELNAWSKATTQCYGQHDSHVLPLYQSWKNDNNQVFYAMPLCQYSLKTIIDEKFNPEKFKSIDFDRFFTDLSNALKCLHDQNIIHHDIRPDNILWCANLNFGHGGWYLSDFSLANEIDPNNNTNINGIDSTYDILEAKYTPPEIYKGEPWTHKSDLWQLGQIFNLYVNQGGPIDDKYKKNIIEPLIKNLIDPNPLIRTNNLII